MYRETEIVSFWGKGGVGKTTCASSAAVYLAVKGFKTLLITSDPTPSLSDIMGIKIGPKITKIKQLNLDAIELDEKTIIEMWKNRFGDEVFSVISSFFPVDESIIDYVAGAPGIGDEFMLAYILDVYNSGKYDFIVWDTAPAGGTLKLLKLEEQFYKHLGEAAKLYLSLKSILMRIKKRGGQDPLEIINNWRKLAENVLNLISSDNFTAYIVTIPEWLSVSQTKRIFEELSEFKVKIGSLIINQVIKMDSSKDPLWKSRAEIHGKYLKILEETYGSYPGTTSIPIQTYEIKGVEALIKFSKNMREILDSKLSNR